MAGAWEGRGCASVAFLSPLRGWLAFLLLSTHGLRPFDKLRAGCGVHSWPLRGWVSCARDPSLHLENGSGQMTPNGIETTKNFPDGFLCGGFAGALYLSGPASQGSRFLFQLAFLAAAHFGHPFSRIHSAAAFGRTAAAGSGFFVVVKVVIPDKFFASRNVADGEEPDAAVDLVNFAVGVAGMVQISAESVAVDDGFAIIESVEVSAGDAVVSAVGFFNRDALAGILDYARSLANGLRGINANGMNGRRPNDKRHELISHGRAGLGNTENREI